MYSLVFINADKVDTETSNKFLSIIEGSCKILGKRIIYPSSKTFCDFGLFETGEHSHIYERAIDLSVVFGGDGTILAAANYLHEQGFPIGPIMGVNFGKLGYLAHYNAECFEQQFLSLLTDIKLQSLQASNRVVLECLVNNEKHLAFNDFVIDIGPPFRMTELELSIDGKLLSKIRGDGIVISTPTGSTAYNLSVGGPVVEPDVGGIIITPAAPHNISMRPVVVNCNRTITVKVTKSDGAWVILDGQRQFLIAGQREFVIRQYEEPFRLVEPKSGFMDAVTNKLKWGH